jgi:hypothetical protein
MKQLKTIAIALGLGLILFLALLGVAFIDHAVEFQDVLWMAR